MQPLLSAFCDGEAKPEQVAALREHLRACPRCRATLRAYRAAPAAAAALPLPASLWQRLRDSVSELFGRFGGGGDAVPQAAAGTGAGSVAAVAKVAAVCVGAAGGAAACVAGGLVPNPIHSAGEHDRPPFERRHAELPAPVTPQPEPEPEPEPAPQPKPERDREPKPAPEPESEGEAAVAEPAPVENEATEYVPPPEPVAEPAPVASSGGGSPAGEFGP
jgi:hypothetical protein